MNDRAQLKPAPHVRAAFINAIAEEGTKAEAVEYLQKEWNENCQLRQQVAWWEKQYRQVRAQVERQPAPIAWIVKWRTVHTPENASAYLNEQDAQRAAKNVAMYAHASDVMVIPAFAGAGPVFKGNDA